MDKPVIKKTIDINASTKKVWSVFTDPTITKQMGGEYVSDWKVGSSFGWKGKDSSVYTNGKIIELEPGKLLKHSLLDLKDKDRLLSVITYEFIKNGDSTILSATEEINYEITDYLFKEANEGWDAALQLVKYVAEKL
ncbi:Activator of Hsp90 ATPase homolog 1-like protein [Chitinophaga ginsengisegetis]|uniref:Activator of Hsp90 ATPase homolog 1-like protein n=1 Tax=Chitinophaga ginsengisegetis TaxID=393003 RepID=A0A1T5NN07_9BACT|nr:SRPBCC domain-containing protein [Chitinophaga ginsengisegetis]SKD01861.1 Activator of Hsp90 ATPase homolog 1-like protein [Chitinophaga ginsengisegetis]